MDELLKSLESKLNMSCERELILLLFVTSLSMDKVKEFVEFVYKKSPKLAKGIVEYLDEDGIVELNKIPCSEKDFTAWSD